MSGLLVMMMMMIILMFCTLCELGWCRWWCWSGDTQHCSSSLAVCQLHHCSGQQPHTTCSWMLSSPSDCCTPHTSADQCRWAGLGIWPRSWCWCGHSRCWSWSTGATLTRVTRKRLKQTIGLWLTRASISYLRYQQQVHDHRVLPWWGLAEPRYTRSWCLRWVSVSPGIMYHGQWSGVSASHGTWKVKDPPAGCSASVITDTLLHSTVHLKHNHGQWSALLRPMFSPVRETQHRDGGVVAPAGVKLQ